MRSREKKNPAEIMEVNYVVDIFSAVVRYNYENKRVGKTVKLARSYFSFTRHMRWLTVWIESTWPLFFSVILERLVLLSLVMICIINLCFKGFVHSLFKIKYFLFLKFDFIQTCHSSISSKVNAIFEKSSIISCVLHD